MLAIRLLKQKFLPSLRPWLDAASWPAFDASIRLLKQKFAPKFKILSRCFTTSYTKVEEGRASTKSFTTDVRTLVHTTIRKGAEMRTTHPTTNVRGCKALYPP